ncbi:MAG: SEL1-like repeat protein [Proteobacteria bacterium]|nr:SEL1-like repeat protein [Pseudomonadota bacterium]
MSKTMQLLLIVVLLAIPLAVPAGDAFPGQAPSRSKMRTQEKVDSLFEKGDYERAMFIYKKELAPIGDKFAQYMVGYMHLAGKGVHADAIVASAWYRLAAERGNEQFVRVRDKLLALMNDEQRARSDSLFIELRRRMGDAVLISQLIKEDIAILRGRRGPAVLSSPDFKGNNFRTPSSNFADATIRLKPRVDYLMQLIDSDETLSRSEQDMLSKALRDAQREIDAYYASD